MYNLNFGKTQVLPSLLLLIPPVSVIFHGPDSTAYLRGLLLAEHEIEAFQEVTTYLNSREVKNAR